MTHSQIIGLIGGLILVLGAARGEGKKPINPRKSTKDRLFAIGGVFLLIYAIFWYLEGGNILYIFLEIFVCFASRLKMMKKHGKFDMRILGMLWLGLISASFFINKSPDTLRFIAGFIGIALGYTIKAGTVGRNAALTLGGILIAFFSLLQSNRIFLGVNIFFAFFSAYHRMKCYVEEKD